MQRQHVLSDTCIRILSNPRYDALFLLAFLAEMVQTMINGKLLCRAEHYDPRAENTSHNPGYCARFKRQSDDCIKSA